MKLVVFGSTGSIGRPLVEQALSQGHIVTAFVRDASKLNINHPNLKFFQGDVLDFTAVEKAVKGQDVVLCSLGAARKGTVRSEGTKHIIRAMENAGVKRFICQTSLGVGDSKGNLNFFWKYIMVGMFLRQAFQDHEVQEKYVKQESKLDWIIVRPGAFTNDALTGKYKHGFSTTYKDTMLKISRNDVADFMLKQLTDNTYLRRTPGLAY